jgi:glycerol-3-phosphate dehydrogenase
MNIALIMSAVKHGATVANYCEVTQLHKNHTGKLTGATVRDNLTGKEWPVRAKVVLLSSGNQHFR